MSSLMTMIQQQPLGMVIDASRSGLPVLVRSRELFDLFGGRRPPLREQIGDKAFVTFRKWLEAKLKSSNDENRELVFGKATFYTGSRNVEVMVTVMIPEAPKVNSRPIAVHFENLGPIAYPEWFDLAQTLYTIEEGEVEDDLNDCKNSRSLADYSTRSNSFCSDDSGALVTVTASKSNHSSDSSVSGNSSNSTGGSIGDAPLRRGQSVRVSL